MVSLDHLSSRYKARRRSRPAAGGRHLVALRAGGATDPGGRSESLEFRVRLLRESHFFIQGLDEWWKQIAGGRVHIYIYTYVDIHIYIYICLADHIELTPLPLRIKRAPPANKKQTLQDTLTGAPVPSSSVVSAFFCPEDRLCPIKPLVGGSQEKS